MERRMEGDEDGLWRLGWSYGDEELGEETRGR